MWLPSINFITLHYAYIICMGLLGPLVLYPYGNLKAVDAYFFGASASTESGLNTVDVNDLKTYQQLYLYFIPVLTNLGFINIAVVVVRLFWFRKHLKTAAPGILAQRRRFPGAGDVEGPKPDNQRLGNEGATPPSGAATGKDTMPPSDSRDQDASAAHDGGRETHITFHPSTDQHPRNNTALYVPSPRERDLGYPLVEKTKDEEDDESDGVDDLKPERSHTSSSNGEGPSVPCPRRRRRSRRNSLSMSQSRSIDRVAEVATSVFVLGSESAPRQRCPSAATQVTRASTDMPNLSRHATVGRNSRFHNLSSRDLQELGGIEYRSLKLLLKIVLSYFFGIHLFGAICLLGWVQTANPKYKEYLQSVGQDKNWWAFFSAQTMVDNLGFTLTPDSMVSFRDATFPMILMSFLAFAGNTLYPVCLRLVIWTMSKLTPRGSVIQEPLSFLLNHPRRCYTLLFPSRPTWILFGIIFSLNSIDTLLIIVLDLHNPEVAALPPGSRVVAAIFQAASSRHTGTSTFNLGNVNPAVQLSLLVMMYIAIFPIALSIRASNTYEERSLGIWGREGSLDETNSKSYLMTHVKNQLTFDLWYIFLGAFCICIAESDRIMDNKDPAFSVFAILFEVTSGYGNVGLSLGYPDINTSLSGKFKTFSKLVVCFMMIRGRHRGLPYTLDRAIMLPDENLNEDEATTAQ